MLIVMPDIVPALSPRFDGVEGSSGALDVELPSSLVLFSNFSVRENCLVFVLVVPRKLSKSFNSAGVNDAVMVGDPGSVEFLFVGGILGSVKYAEEGRRVSTRTAGHCRWDRSCYEMRRQG